MCCSVFQHKHLQIRYYRASMCTCERVYEYVVVYTSRTVCHELVVYELCSSRTLCVEHTYYFSNQTLHTGLAKLLRMP